MSEEFNLPLIQDRKAFLKAQPLFCVNCKKFTDIFRQYCEHCGSKNSLRKATKKDFNKYIKNQLNEKVSSSISITYDYSVKPEAFPSISLISKEERKSFLKVQRYFCSFCKKFSIRNRGYCENCGSRYSLRRSNIKDFDRYMKGTQPIIHDQLKEQKTPPKPMVHITPRKIEEPLSIPTILEKNEGVPESKEKLDQSKKVMILSKIPVASPKKEAKLEVSMPSEIPAIPTKKEEQLEVSIPSEIPTISPKKEEKLEVSIPSEIPAIPTKKEEKLEVSIPSEIPPILDKKEKNCKFCGKELIHETIFCPQCGYVIKSK